MKKEIPSEISDLVQFVLPILSSEYNYPQSTDQKRVKIHQIPIRVGSKVYKADVVYYYEGVPVLLLEAKKENKTEEEAQEEALSYVRNFPVKEYSKDGRRPKFIATSVGKGINFYIHRYKISRKGDYQDWLEKISVLPFKKLLSEYGLTPEYKPISLISTKFLYDFLYELMVIYDTREDRVITINVIKNIALQILSYLEDSENYVSRQPYVSLDLYRDRQSRIRQLFNQYNIKDSLVPQNAKVFRDFVLRAFQGGEFNQYMTEQCVIDFMVNMVNPQSNWKVLDFECGSGGFLATVLEKGKVPLINVKGIDIDELPCIIAKTYLAIYSCKHNKKNIDLIPIERKNGLFNCRNNWDLVISNPAGSNKYDKYKDLKKVLKNLESDLDVDGHKESFSEYNFSIQQAIRSAKVGGKICLILPEGFFATAQDDVLRKYVAKHCKVLAIISLPRGVFKKGKESVRTQKATQTTSMKMSILYAQKVSEAKNKEGVDLDKINLDYPVFIANIPSPKSTPSEIDKWLKPELDFILEQWKLWEKK